MAAINKKNVLIEVSVKSDEAKNNIKRIEEAQLRYAEAISATSNTIIKIRAAESENVAMLKLKAKELNNVNTSYNSLSAQYQINIKRLNLMDASQRKNSEAGKELTKQTIEIKEKMKAMSSSLEKSTSKVDKAKEAYIATMSDEGKELRRIAAAKAASVRDLKNEEKLARSVAGSYNALSAQYSLNVSKLNQMSMAERTNTAAGKKLSNETLLLRNRMKAMQSSVGNNSLEVGNYKDNVRNAIAQSGIFGRQLAVLTRVQATLKAITAGLADNRKNLTVTTKVASLEEMDMAKSTGFLSGAQKIANKTMLGSARAAKILKFALISTGIGAIVVVLGSLIAAFLSTQKGIDAVNRLLAPMKGYFQGIIGVVQDLALNIFSQLKDRSTIAINAMSNGILHIRLLWNKLSGDTEEYAKLQKKLTANQKESAEAQERLNKKTDAFGKIIDGTGDRLAKAAKIQRRIVDLGIKIQEAEINLNKQRAISLDFQKEQEQIAKDTTKSEKERKEAADKAVQSSKELSAYEMSILETKIEKMKLEQSINDTSREEQKELADLEAERISKATEDRRRQLRFIGVLNSAAKASADDIKQHEDELKEGEGDEDDADKEAQRQIDAKKKIKEKIDAWEAEQEDLAAETDEEKRELQLERLQARADEELEMLKDQLAKKLIAQGDYDKAVELLENNLAAKKKKLNKNEKENHKETEKGKVAESTKALDATTELLGKESTAGKAAAVGKASINMWQGVSEVWKTPSLLPEPIATASKIVNSGVALAAGGKTVANIKAQKYETGGIVGGSSFSGDNITARVNSGEMILNQTQQKNLFNQMNSGTASNISPKMITDAVINAIGSIPVIVQESDITDTQRRVSVRESEFSI